MNIIKGIAASPGIALGKCNFIDKKIKPIKQYVINDIESEIIKFQNAKQISISQLEETFETFFTKFKDDAVIFKSQQYMILDSDLNDKVIEYIKIHKYNAEYAVFKVIESYTNEMAHYLDKDNLISERIDDIKDIGYRIINNMSNELHQISFNVDKNSIIAIHSLVPSETLMIEAKDIWGIITNEGGTTSHVSILAKNMKIPSIVGVKYELQKLHGKFIILDGFSGEILVNPSQVTIDEYNQKKIQKENQSKILQLALSKPTVTSDNKSVMLLANIISSKDVDIALKNGAEGIGLLRSEFLYMNKHSPPSEEELFNEYKNTIIKANKQPVIIRTLDIGSDKKLKYINLPKENNPALGLRAIRLCFHRPDLFKTQLRALIRSSIFGNLHILVPMITSVSEIKKVKKIIEQIKHSLIQDCIPFNDKFLLGVMIETPASVIISDLLAKEVDFFCIGTNDLIQYSLACDRDNINMNMHIYSANNIAILRMIHMVVNNAHSNNIWVEVCGEAASDPLMTNNFIALDVDKLSIDHNSLLNIKNKIHKMNYNRSKKDLLSMLDF